MPEPKPIKVSLWSNVWSKNLGNSGYWDCGARATARNGDEVLVSGVIGAWAAGGHGALVSAGVASLTTIGTSLYTCWGDHKQTASECALASSLTAVGALHVVAARAGSTTTREIVGGYLETKYASLGIFKCMT